MDHLLLLLLVLLLLELSKNDSRYQQDTFRTNDGQTKALGIDPLSGRGRRRFGLTEKARRNPRLTVRCAYPDTSLPPTEVTFGLSPKS